MHAGQKPTPPAPMRITLHQLVPTPLPDASIRSSEVWGESVSLENSKCIRLVAQSGKGKSTLLHILYGLRFDYKGSCEIEQEQVSTFSTGRWRELWTNQLSLLFQDLRLFQHMTARQNLELLPKVYQSGPSLEEMCKVLEIDHLLDRAVSTLSLGQQQRFALVRNLLKPFKWLLLDEPFSHLDDDNARRAARLIETSAQIRNASVLYTSLSQSSPLPCDLCLSL